MCGLAGIVDFESRPAEGLLRRMLPLLRHRGPDAFGIYRDSQAGLAHARLRIIDLQGGDQPVHNEEETVWLVYNGEIFNYPELRQSLADKGHHFYTRTDTEVIVHLYEERGPQLFEELNGQYALALWDRARQRLLLGRDRLGIRPLYYHLSPNKIHFGSEIKALLADPQIPRRLQLETLADIFTCWAPLGSETPFEGIQQIPPGHWAVFSREGLDIQSYWRLSFGAPEDDGRPLNHYVEALEALLSDSTRIRLRADVPVGAYLSGGLDSTTLTGLVKKRFNNRLQTFSVGFSDERFDESVFQNQAAAILNTDHHVVRCAEADIGRAFPRVVWHGETPLLRTAPAPLYLLSALVRDQGFKVVLTGEGADELFAGYDVFKEDQIRRFWARQPWSEQRPRLLARLYPDIFTERTGAALRKKFFQRNLLDLENPAYSHSIRWENTASIKQFFSAQVQGLLRGKEDLPARFSKALPLDFWSWDSLARAQYIEITIFLTNYLLSSQGDRMTMAHGVEGRYPYLDYRVVEFAARLPAHCRLRGLHDKVVLRKLADRFIPPPLARRPKQPYRAPISRCFLGPSAPEYVRDLLSAGTLREAGYFDPVKVAYLVKKAERQGGFLASERENMALVGILSTQLIHEQFVKNFPAPAGRETGKVMIQGAKGVA
ncbi:MAG: asparagine synthase (glutamine-hydrolyzing) [Deltaproteobacteria bacterium]|nr:asparagine synthase (glutamine-hydrolyzing) [Deltaproteobacteria bacterium]